MPKSLRSILGTSHRVKKTSLSPRKPTSSTTRSSPNAQSRTKRIHDDGRDGHDDDDDDEDDDEFAAQLPDLGPITRLLLSDLSLRDVPQVMRYIRSHMFSPMPASGLHSSRSTRTLAVRRGTPPLVTLGHVSAVLGDPSHVEREVAELWARGALRKVRVERRGGMGEALIEAGDLEAMVRDGTGLSAGAREGFVRFLREHPMARAYTPSSSSWGRRVSAASKPSQSESGTNRATEAGGDEMSSEEVDELVRAGFLTSGAAVRDVAGLGGRLLMRPEDRTTLTSVERVSRHASGTVFAVGGRNAVHLAGGGGGGLASSARAGTSPPALSSSSAAASASSHPSSAAPALPSSSAALHSGHDGGAEALRIAVPGHGRYMKLADGTAQWLRDLLAARRWGEGTEAWARERFEGGGLYGTRWKDFWGVEWEWVLGEAVGLGAVELFDTGSVGRGVRGLG